MNAVQFHQWLEHFSTPLVMGILNVTPDSFSDGGQYYNLKQAITHAETMIEQGVDIIDIGGESTRPGATPVPLNEELSRVLPVIEGIRKASDICLSIDTYKLGVMQAAVDTGVDMINDIMALNDQHTLTNVAKLKVPVCLMHMQGTPKTMQNNPSYVNPVLDIRQFFEQRLNSVMEAGVKPEHIIIDPGLGFGKTLEDNLQLLRELKTFTYLNKPICIGISRKSILGSLLAKPINNRTIGGVVAATYAITQGASIIRTHDVEETRECLTLMKAIN